MANQIANITIKNQANADVVYTAARPQGGESTPALWLVKSGSRNSQERLEALVRRSGSNQGYKTTIKITLPVMDTVNPALKVTNMVFDLTVTTPDLMTDAAILDASTRFKNIIASTAIQQIISTSEPAV